MTRMKPERERLRQALNAHLQEAGAAVRSQIRHERADTSTGVGDMLEQADASNQSDVEFALVQLRAETVGRIKEALTRLDDGQYGDCVECGVEIVESRLRALPFAIRCRDCAERDERRSTESRSAITPDANRLSPFATVVGP